MNDDVESERPPLRPLRWDELQDIPHARALKKYRRGVLAAIEHDDLDFLITEIHNTNLWKDAAGEPLPNSPAARMLIACLPTRADEARAMAENFELPAHLLHFTGFGTPRAFLQAWFLFLDTNPPGELLEFLRTAAFKSDSRARAHAREVMEHILRDTLPYIAAMDILEKLRLLRAFAADPESSSHGSHAKEEPVPPMVYAVLDLEHEAYMTTELSWPRIIIMLLAPGFLSVPLSLISENLGDAAGIGGVFLSILILCLMAIQNAYGKFRLRLISRIIAQDLRPADISRALREQGKRYEGLKRHAGELETDPFIHYAEVLRRLARLP